jgi:Flp pilus assembly protein TadG
MKTFLHARDGQAMIEFTLCIMTLFFFILASWDMAYFFWAKTSIQNAVRTAARYAITGNGGFNNPHGDRLTIIMQTVQTYSFNLNPTVTVTCTGACPAYGGNGGSNNAGGPEDTVTIAATYTWTPVILGSFFGGSYTFTEFATFKNEAFSPPTS